MRTVLIDADILAYQIASSQEEVFEFAGRHVLHADLNDGIRELHNALEYIIDAVDADDCELCLTHPYNFRKEVLPTYKENRSGGRKPMILQGLRDEMLENMGAQMWPGLEGDDIIGIYASDPDVTEERVIWSADKDLKTIPGYIWNAEDGRIDETSMAEADYNFLFQTLTGDPTDNYKGCPKVGPVAAQRILYKSCSWEAVVKAYEKAGLTEEDALQQARCARILRHGEYDFDLERPTLWRP